MDKKKLFKILTEFNNAGKSLASKSEELNFIEDNCELILDILSKDYGYIRAYNSKSHDNSFKYYRITAKGIERLKQIKKELRPIGFTIK